jgi:hypothetical protein
MTDLDSRFHPLHLPLSILASCPDLEPGRRLCPNPGEIRSSEGADVERRVGTGYIFSSPTQNRGGGCIRTQEQPKRPPPLRPPSLYEQRTTAL